MSDEVIIRVENLVSCLESDTARRGKRYRLGASRSNKRNTALRDVIADKAKSLFRQAAARPLPSDRRPPIQTAGLHIAPGTTPQ